VRVRYADEHTCRDSDVWVDGCREECACGRESYCAERHSSCYQCFLDRRADFVNCIYCDRWHSPDFDTCFQCRPQGRDEAAVELKRVILTRDGFRCRYCGAAEGELQVDPRLIRPKCPPLCLVEHNHRWPCKPKCSKPHKHRSAGDRGTCQPYCSTPHSHLIKDDDGTRPVRLHVDHIQPCSKDGTADPWNLQTLCGVCNISKGNDWWAGSRHWNARRLIMAAYLTYLWDFLAADQKEDLAIEVEFYETEFDELINDQAVQLIKADYVSRVKAARPRPPAPIPEPQVEDVPPEWAHLDLPPLRALSANRGDGTH